VRDCNLPFSITPKMICAWNRKTAEFKTSFTISWSTTYSGSDGRNLYFAAPAPLEFVIEEGEYEPAELREFQELEPLKYARWKKCQESVIDSGAPKKCVGEQTEEGDVGTDVGEGEGADVGTDAPTKNEPTEMPTLAAEMIAEVACIPSGMMDDSPDDPLIFMDDPPPKLKWYEDFWQANWQWEYVVIGSGTVMLMAGIIKQIGCFGGRSVLYEMLQTLNEDIDREEEEERNLL